MKYSLPRGFTLIELLVVFVVIAIVAALLLAVTKRTIEGAREAQSAAQARQIIAGIMANAGDTGTFYSQTDIGNSTYRKVTDPLGLPQFLDKGGYLKGTKVWWVPGTRAALEKYGNSFCWSRSSTICGLPLAAMEKPSTIMVLFTNYAYTLPSTNNVPEGSKGGPANPGNGYYVYPFRSGTAATAAYADGHVGLITKP